MECVITPDEAYSKYRLSKIYDNLHFESAWKRFRRNVCMYSVIVFDQNIIGIEGSKKSKKHGQGSRCCNSQKGSRKSASEFVWNSMAGTNG